MSCCCQHDEEKKSCCCAEGAGNAEKGEFPQAPVVGSRRVGHDFAGEKAVVYFTRKIDAEHLKKLYSLVNGEIIGNLQKIGRIHSGVDLFARTGDTNVTYELLNE